MNLKTFAIQGTVQELVELEALLVMFGYDKPNEDWNNTEVKDCKPEFIIAFSKKDSKNGCQVGYYEYIIGYFKSFKASQINEIIKYLES